MTMLSILIIGLLCWGGYKLVNRYPIVGIIFWRFILIYLVFVLALITTVFFVAWIVGA